MSGRYLNNPNPGSSKIPSILYYDKSGNFRGVENGVDFQEHDDYLQMKWCGGSCRVHLSWALTFIQVEAASLTQRATYCDSGSDEHQTPAEENHYRCICGFYALSL